MKGQFFIVATVVMITALIGMAQFFYDFSKIDLTVLEESKGTDYALYVPQALRAAANSSVYSGAGCASADLELEYAEDLLKRKLAEEGFKLTVTHDTSACPAISFDYTLSASGFSSTRTGLTFP